jgi:hypothetical protein
MIMKKILSCFVFLSLYVIASAQNVGIGTTTPQARLHLKNDFEILRLQGESQYISFYNNTGDYCGYLWNRNNTAMDLGTPAGSGFPVYLSPNASPTATFLANGNVGLGITDPVFRLDILGRMRIRHSGETAGIWFNNSSNTATPGFIGMLNDQHVGLYGSGSGWSLLMNTNTGNVSIGAADAGSSKLLVENSGGTALEVVGGIRMRGSNSAASRITVTASNQSDFDASGAALSVIVDNPSCNGDPNALLFITPVQFLQGVPLLVRYDAGIGKWKIRVPFDNTLTIIGNTSPGAIRSCTSGVCSVLTDVALVDLFHGFQVGDSFNVIVIKQ